MVEKQERSGATPQQVTPQTQERQPGIEREMQGPGPIFDNPNYKGSGKLLNKKALITGGDSGIGRSVSLFFAREGADIAIVYLPEEEVDAMNTSKLVESEGRRCLCIPGDIRSSAFCKEVVERTVRELGGLDILVNNAAKQFLCPDITELQDDKIRETFETNILSMFYMCREAVKHMREGSCIINSTSINAFKGHKELVDYTATKGAILAFTRSLSAQLYPKGIRVNSVAPGPIWTPLIPSSFPEEKVETFGKSATAERPGQPWECAPSYVFLASNVDSSFISGSCLHPNGGVILNN